MTTCPARVFNELHLVNNAGNVQYLFVVEVTVHVYTETDI